MAHKILPAIVILTVSCQALDHHPYSVTAPGSFYGNAQMRDSNCADLPGSISLNFSDVGLGRLNSYFTSGPNVGCLSFDSNEIVQVSPSAFRLMPNLLYLSLARNRLNFANFSQLEGHPNLRALVLDENRDVNLTEGPIFQLENEFPRLLYLHARNCGIRDVASLAFAPRLMHLYLAFNDLAASNLSFLEEAAQGLRILDLSDNGLQRFDAVKLDAVNELRLDGNRFDRLCAKPDCDSEHVLALAGVKRLKHLSLARNVITNIEPSAFEDAEELTYLDLSDNQIQSVEDGTFDKLTKLKNLTLKGNLLTEIPDIRMLKTLYNLSLANNNLEVVRNGSLFENVYIKTLNLSNNNIASVQHGAFARQHFLETLDLSNNKLTNFTSTWLSSMFHLRVLYVNNNLLTTIDNLHLGSLRDRAKLEEVYLQNNRITKFYSHSFSYHAFKRIPDISLIFFDAANSSVQSKNAEECKCDCSNDIDSLNLEWNE